MKISHTILAVSLTLLPLAASAESVDQLIKMGDQHAQNYQEEKALEFYLAAVEQDGKNPYLQVAISREYRHLLSDARSRKEKLRYGKIALKHALTAAKLGPGDAEAQLAPAITYGKILPLMDDRGEKLKVSRNIKSAIDRTISLDAGNDIAWHILGRWHHGFAEVGGAKRFIGGFVYGDIPKSTYADAAACFRKAIELNPSRLMHHVELGCVYCAMGKKSQARKFIKRGLVMTETEKDDPATKRHGRQMLKGL